MLLGNLVHLVEGGGGGVLIITIIIFVHSHDRILDRMERDLNLQIDYPYDDLVIEIL